MLLCKYKSCLDGDMVGRRSLIKRGAGVIAGAGAIAAGVVHASENDKASARELVRIDDPRHYVLMVLDRSGSMSNLKPAVIEGVNTFLNEQVDKNGMFISVVQFDSFKTKDDCYCEDIFDFIPADQTRRLTDTDYQPRGMTPLFAAMAEGISKLEQKLRPIDRALMVVQTDGLNNASPPEITKAVVSGLVKSKKAEGNWTFVFMGADIDAWGEGESLHIPTGNTYTYSNTLTGTNVAYTTASTGTSNWYATTGGGLSTSDIKLRARASSNFFSATDDQSLEDKSTDDKKPTT